jgi:hypothetical protein
MERKKKKSTVHFSRHGGFLATKGRNKCGRIGGCPPELDYQKDCHKSNAIVKLHARTSHIKFVQEAVYIYKWGRDLVKNEL